jgi:hypothetical protein
MKMLIIELLAVSLVLGVPLGFGLRAYDEWRERVTQRQIEAANKSE